MLVLYAALTSAAAAQYEKEDTGEKKGFKKENLFTGGGLVVSFSNYTTVLGASPIIGYSLTNWIDAGLSLNFVYSSNRHVTYSYYDPYTGLTQYFVSDDKLKQTVTGPGAFLRIYPAKFLFVQGQFEKNFISQKITYANGYPSEKQRLSAPSFLVGAGYCSGRYGKGSLFYYVSLMVDVAKDKDSPYTEVLSNGRVNVLPVVRAGLQIPLFQGKDNRGF